jgi:hypothetical protein
MDRMQIAIVDRDENQVRIWVRVDLTDAEEAPAARPRSPTAQQKAEASTMKARAKWHMGVPTWIDKATGLPRQTPHPSATAKLLDENTALVCFRVMQELAEDPAFPLAAHAADQVGRHLRNAGIALTISEADAQPIADACSPTLEVRRDYRQH